MKTSKKIVEYLRNTGQVTGNELIDYLGITDRAVRKQLKALLDNDQVKRTGKPPRVYYSIADKPISSEARDSSIINAAAKRIIEKEFLYITPRGTIQEGTEGFIYWCNERSLDLAKTAERYKQTMLKYSNYKKAGLIDGMYKLKTSFDEVALDKVFYIDFYSVEIFGKTKLGQLLLFAKQSQNRKLINELSDIIKPIVLRLIDKYEVDGVGFIPPTVRRELQLVKQLQSRLNLNVRTIPIFKVKTPIAVPQKTLNKIEDRIINARETISVDDTRKYNNILLIDDAVGSGSTLNETAKKIGQRGLCKGKIIGLSITGSFKGFDVISEV
ncbi:MAG TPA: HTH domain-containing protein [Candidatus Saccharimonadales bacterium]|nr:HTH domain-containing protein [Candidatus Saccharimonadales bacterium]